VARIELKPWSRLQAGVVVGLAVFLVVGWIGVSTVGQLGGDDAGEHLLYAQYLDAHNRLPGKSVNYEYASPPLFAVAAVAAERAVRHLSSEAIEAPWNPVTRVFWLALVAVGAFALTANRRDTRIAGAAGLVLAALWGLDEAISLARSEAWTAGQLIALVCGTAFLAVTGLIAREVWPGHPRRAVAAGAFAAAYPVVFRMSVLFHPEMPFALLCSLAVLLFLRGANRGWPRGLGWGLGAALGAAALTRQPAVVVMACVGAAGLYLGRRAALPFLLRATIVVVLLAGPWWGYQTARFGNPLQSNLAPRASLMMPRQPLSFYVSFPLRSLVLHPYREDFSNQLLPKLHAELWSDWFLIVHGPNPTRLEQVTMSSQSVLGFVADALALGGLFVLALPAGIRALRGSRTAADVGLGLLALLAVSAFTSFVIELIRFPQRQGDPIKSSYLLFTAPAWAIFSVAAWSTLRRHRRLAAALAVVAVLYVVSYSSDLGAALSRTTTSGPPSGGGAAGYVDLSTSFQQNSPTTEVGGDIDFLTAVGNTGNQTASNVVLTLKLPPSMRLLGPPFYERGSGCKGTRTIVCNLDFLPGETSTFIRYSVEVNEPGAQTMIATASSSTPDANPSNNTSTFTVTPS
jgi:uncharacterized repeat protein (TIGR01451 family)